MVDRAGCVLVIEANAHLRRLITTLLSALNITQIIESRTPAALTRHHLSDDRAPDLIIMDWAADPTDATLFAHQIRSGAWIDARTPILGLSGYLHHSILEQAWQAGVDDLIAKPISALELLQRAAALLHERWTWQPSQDIMAAE